MASSEKVPNKKNPPVCNRNGLLTNWLFQKITHQSPAHPFFHRSWVLAALPLRFVSLFRKMLLQMPFLWQIAAAGWSPAENCKGAPKHTLVGGRIKNPWNHHPATCPASEFWFPFCSPLQRGEKKNARIYMPRALTGQIKWEARRFTALLFALHSLSTWELFF